MISVGDLVDDIGDIHPRIKKLGSSISKYGFERGNIMEYREFNIIEIQIVYDQ